MRGSLEAENDKVIDVPALHAYSQFHLRVDIHAHDGWSGECACVMRRTKHGTSAAVVASICNACSIKFYQSLFLFAALHVPEVDLPRMEIRSAQNGVDKSPTHPRTLHLTVTGEGMGTLEPRF